MLEKIGILGFGVVGNSALHFFKNAMPNLVLGIYDHKKIKVEKNLNFYEEKNVKKFFYDHKKILISPGINIDKFFKKNNINKEYKKKCICELDLFSKFFKTKTVAVTGTLGKTTITSLLGDLISKLSLQKQKNKILKTFVGGNIGKCMLDLIQENDLVDFAILELSSFQLILNKKFAPDIAVWSNFYPNHLDWHSDNKEYFYSKFKIFEYQNENQFAIIPFDFLSNDFFLNKIHKIKSKICIITQNLDKTLLKIKKLNLKKYFVFFVKNNSLFLYSQSNNKLIFNLKNLFKTTFIENWLFILVVLYLLKLNLNDLESKIYLENHYKNHRLELFANMNGIDFYNDSKATVIQSTIKALSLLNKNNKPIILIIGGLSKGVDRAPLLQFILKVKNLKEVFCFGLECFSFCSFASYSSLKEVVNAMLKVAKPGDQVLFSPSGSSFDLFKNYMHRGDSFKQLVLDSFKK